MQLEGPYGETPVVIEYTNWKGETALRTIRPVHIYWGKTEWHPEDQWMLTAWDCAKGEIRDFAWRDLRNIPGSLEENPVDGVQIFLEAVRDNLEGAKKHDVCDEWLIENRDGIAKELLRMSDILSAFATPAQTATLTRVNAATAAAYGDAANVASLRHDENKILRAKWTWPKLTGLDDVSEEIRALATPDQTAALDRLIAEAVKPYLEALTAIGDLTTIGDIEFKARHPELNAALDKAWLDQWSDVLSRFAHDAILAGSKGVPK